MMQAQFRWRDSDSTFLEIQSPLSLLHSFHVFARADTCKDLHRCAGSNVRLIEIATKSPEEYQTEKYLSTHGILITESMVYPDCFERIGYFSSIGDLDKKPEGNSYCCFDGAQAIEFTMV